MSTSDTVRSAMREQAELNRARRLRLEAKTLAFMVRSGRPVYSVELADELHLGKARGRAYAAQLLVRMERDGYATRDWSRLPARNGNGRNYYSPTDKARAAVAAVPTRQEATP